MKKAFRKYFVVSLSFLLILSNFSFATHLMICEMGGDNDNCECSHEKQTNYPGISLTQEKSKCCNEKTTELANSNTLLNYTSNEFDSYTILNILFTDLDAFLPKINSSYNFFAVEHFQPLIDIPVFNSSLLI